MDYYLHNDALRAVIDLIESGIFTSGDRELFKPIIDSLLHEDPYMLFADYQDYIDCQERVGHLYADQKRWSQTSIMNTARMGKFSSDRSVKEYSRKVWDVRPCPVKLKWNEPA